MAEAVVVLLKLPQAPVLPHVTDQVTPALAESFVTVAVRVVVRPAASDAGAPDKATEIVAGGVLELLLPPQPASTATIVTAMSNKIE